MTEPISADAQIRIPWDAHHRIARLLMIRRDLGREQEKSEREGDVERLEALRQRARQVESEICDRIEVYFPDNVL